MKLSELAQKLGCRLEGPSELEITGVAGMEHAGPGQITFLANRKYFALLKTTRASAILLEEGVAIERDRSQPQLVALRSANPYFAFAQAIEIFYLGPKYAPGIHPTAIIAKTARIGEGAHIGPYCYVDEEAEIGRSAVLHSFVTIYRGAKIGDDFTAHAHSVVREHCRIGNRVILQNGAVIGGDGFGFAKRLDGTWYKMAQSGPAVLEDDVRWHEYFALRTSRPRWLDQNRQQLHPGRASRHGWTPGRGRWHGHHRAERRSQRRPCAGVLLRVSRRGESPVVENDGCAESASRTAEARTRIGVASRAAQAALRR